MQQSRVIPVEVATAFEHTLPMALPTLFSRWYGPIAPIKAIRDQSGDWSSVGQTRTVVQVGGGSMREELTLTGAFHHTPELIRRAVELLESEALNPEGLITHRMDLAEVPHALEPLVEIAPKTLVIPQQLVVGAAQLVRRIGQER